MKKLLLTSAIVAVAGAATAEVTWTGEAEFGYRSHYDDGVNTGFAETKTLGGKGLYVDADLEAKASAELDNGISASIAYGLDLDYAAEGSDNFVTLNDFPTLKFESSVGNLTVGDVDHAAHDLFDGPDAMDVGFTEVEDELVARLNVEQFGMTIGGSYTILDSAGSPVTPFGDIGLASGSTTLGVKGEIAGALFSLGYEFDNFWYHETIGVSAGYTWNGIRGVVAYATDNNGRLPSVGTRWTDSNTSIGLTAGYTMQSGLDIALGVASNEAADGTSYMGYNLDVAFEAMGADVELGYEMTDDNNDNNDGVTADVSYTLESAGVTLNAGYDFGEYNVIDDNADGAYYVGAEYGLGGGASVFAAYATGHEMGDPEYDAGASLGVKLEF